MIPTLGDRLANIGGRIAKTTLSALAAAIVIGLWRAADWDLTNLAVLILAGQALVLWWCFAGLNERLDEHTDRDDQQEAEQMRDAVEEDPGPVTEPAMPVVSPPTVPAAAVILREATDDGWLDQWETEQRAHLDAELAEWRAGHDMEVGT